MPVAEYLEVLFKSALYTLHLMVACALRKLSQKHSAQPVAQKTGGPEKPRAMGSVSYSHHSSGTPT